MRFFALMGEYLRMAWHALRAHKLRSALTTLGILIGVTTIITIFTTIQGLNEYVIGQLSIIGSSTVYVEKYPWVIRGDFWKYRNRKDFTMKELNALKEFSTEIDHISPQLLSMKNVKYKSEQLDRVMIIGTNEDYKYTDSVNPEKGRFFTEIDIDRNHPVCVLGHELAKILFDDNEAIGKRIRIDGQKYKVIGVLERQGSFFGQSMDNYAIIPIGTFRRAYGFHRSMRIAINTADIGRIEEMKDEVRGILRRVRKVAPLEEDDFAFNQQDQLADLYREMTTVLYAIVFVIGSMSLVVGGIGIMNIMLVSVTERTREIGIRKAIGAKRKNILSQFLIESVAVASVGGLLGIILGFVAGNAILAQMELSTSVSLSSVLIGFGFSTFVGVLAGFYPAFKAAKLNPIDSLHYE